MVVMTWSEGNGRVVPLPPLEESISPHGQGVEKVLAAKGHDLGALGYEQFVDSEQA